MDTRPIILDLFCGQGGCSEGYSRAGFKVVGVNLNFDKKGKVVPTRLYPFELCEMDCIEAMRILLSGGTIRVGTGMFTTEYRLSDFAAIHASPPCQAYCALKHMSSKRHPELVEPVRELLQATGLPYVIENVPGAPLINPVILCGSMFRLGTKCGAELKRHRLFETNWPLTCDLKCDHGWAARTIMVAGSSPRDRSARIDGRRTEDGASKHKTITVHGSSAESNATGCRHTKENRRRTMSISGHAAEVTGAEKSRAKTVTICGEGARIYATEPRTDRPRTIMVVGETPRDPAAEREKFCITGSTAQQFGVTPGSKEAECATIRETFPVSAARDAMGIQWMGMAGLSQAIPPAYTEYIGIRLRKFIG